MSTITPISPSSPHVEVLRRHCTNLPGNSTRDQRQNIVSSSPNEYLITQKVLAQQSLGHYQTFFEEQYQNQQNDCKGIFIFDVKQKSIRRFTFTERQIRTPVTIDEHFRKSLGDIYDQLNVKFLTSNDSSSNSSTIERTPGVILKKYKNI